MNPETDKPGQMTVQGRVLEQRRDSSVRLAGPELPETSFGSGGNMPFRDYWRCVKRHLWMVVGVTVFSTAGMAIYMAGKPSLYQAQARVQVDMENNPAGAKSGSVVVSNPAGDLGYFNTQLQILSGARLLRRVIRLLDLTRDEAFTEQKLPGSPWQKLMRKAGFGSKDQSGRKAVQAVQVPLAKSIAHSTSEEDLAETTRLAPYVASLKQSLEVEPVREPRLPIKETRLIDITFTHTDPELAAKVANAIADAYVQLNLETRNAVTNSAADFLQKRITEVQAQMVSEQERLGQFAKEHQILSLDPAQNTVVERLLVLNRQLMEAENERSLADSALRAGSLNGVGEALGTAQIAGIESMLANLRQRRAQLLVENTEEWPEVKETDQQITALQREIKDLLQSRQHRAVLRERELKNEYNQQLRQVEAQNEAAVSYRIIEQEIETNKNLLAGLLQRSKENSIALADVQNNVHVVDYAIIPAIPVAPNRSRAVGLTLILSLVCGLWLAVLVERFDDSIWTIPQLERTVQLPALAAIQMNGQIGSYGLLSKLNGRRKNSYAELLIGSNPPRLLMEAYRHLRTSLLVPASRNHRQVILVTSSVPGEGKTTTAVNLAMSLSLTGAKVLLIDADLRNPCLHTMFGLKNQSGLSEILSKNTKGDEILNTVVRDRRTGLSLLLAGKIPTNAAELLGSHQMHQLLGTAKNVFTHVIIDSSPIAPFTDGVLLSTLADGVLLVVQSGRTSQEIVRLSKNTLQDAGANILGVVLTKLPRQKEYEAYYKYYYPRAVNN